MIPDAVKNFLIKNKEEQGCFCLAINEQLKIVQYFGNPKLLGITPPKYRLAIFEFFPGLITETFDGDFEIPFYNINKDHVCNIYFLKFPTISYLVLVDKSEIFQITKKYQQFAHDDNISKNKFKRLAEELDRAKQKLKKSNQEKATLIAMLSHELGTPLTSILGYSELLLNKNVDVNKGLKIINRNAIYLKHMIENTLLFGSSEAGGIQVQIEKIAVKELFNVLKATMLPAATNKNIALHMFYTGDEYINIDITRTKQVLLNLLNNAVKYTETGSVELKFSIIKNNYVFSVIDTGLGVPPEQQQNIFNPWKRIEENNEKGSGIGLFISQKLTTAIGGELKLKYSSAEFGSIFQLLIPCREIPKQLDVKTSQKLIKCQNKSLLVIDDDNDILDLIEALLYECGLKIYSVTDFPKAQVILDNNKIDIVLTDLNIGAIKASTFVMQIQAYNKDMPILLMTALPSEKLKDSFKSQGFHGVITKPLSSNNLLSTLLDNL